MAVDDHQQSVGLGGGTPPTKKTKLDSTTSETAGKPVGFRMAGCNPKLWEQEVGHCLELVLQATPFAERKGLVTLQVPTAET